MPTPVLICGAECGLSNRGSGTDPTPPSPTISHVNGASTAAYTVVTSGPSPMRSTRCLKWADPAGGGSVESLSWYLGAVQVSTPVTIVGRFYVYYETLPTSTGVRNLWRGQGNSVGAHGAIHLYQNEMRLCTGVIGTSSQNFANLTDGPVISAGQWYLIDLQWVYTTGNLTTYMKVNGTDAGSYSYNATIPTLAYGLGPYLEPNSGQVVYFDDVMFSLTAGDYPIGGGYTVGLYPNGDRTNGVGAPQHVYSATTDFDKNGTTHTALGAQNVESTSWQSLKNPLSPTIDNTKFITGVTGTQTEHLVWTMDDMPADAAAIQGGVCAVSTHHSASATGNAQVLALMDTSANAKEFDAVGTYVEGSSTGVDLSEVTLLQQSKTVTSFANTGAPTIANVNDLCWLWTNTDVNPDTIIDGVCLEVAYTKAAAPGPSLPVRGRTARRQYALARGGF